MAAVIISFSGRRDGNCNQIGEYVQRLTGGTMYSFANLDITPCGKCCYECFQKNELCPYVEDDEYTILESITQSDCAYFIIPNYCDYPCANYFIFNERSCCYFQNHQDRLDAYENVPKKFIVVSNTEQDNFRNALAQQSTETPDILFLRAKDYGKNSITANLLTSPEAAEVIKTFVTKINSR